MLERIEQWGRTSLVGRHTFMKISNDWEGTVIDLQLYCVTAASHLCLLTLECAEFKLGCAIAIKCTLNLKD